MQKLENPLFSTICLSLYYHDKYYLNYQKDLMKREIIPLIIKKGL